MSGGVPQLFHVLMECTWTTLALKLIFIFLWWSESIPLLELRSLMVPTFVFHMIDEYGAVMK